MIPAQEPGFTAYVVELLRRKPKAQAVTHGYVLDQLVRWCA